MVTVVDHLDWWLRVTPLGAEFVVHACGDVEGRGEGADRGYIAGDVYGIAIRGILRMEGDVGDSDSRGWVEDLQVIEADESTGSKLLFQVHAYEDGGRDVDRYQVRIPDVYPGIRYDFNSLPVRASGGRCLDQEFPFGDCPIPGFKTETAGPELEAW